MPRPWASTVKEWMEPDGSPDRRHLTDSLAGRPARSRNRSRPRPSTCRSTRPALGCSSTESTRRETPTSGLSALVPTCGSSFTRLALASPSATSTIMRRPTTGRAAASWRSTRRLALRSCSSSARPSRTCSSRRYVEAQTVAEPKPALFADVEEEELLRYGIPPAWLADVFKADEDTLLELADHLPAEAAEALLDLAVGANTFKYLATLYLSTLYSYPQAVYL